MKVSIALATFNGERFLNAQLASLRAQTLPPFEVVVGDDGSTDRTAEIVAAFAAEAPFPIHFHRNDTRLGYQENFMRCAARCGGDLIAFCDQDDVWLPHKLTTQVRHFADPRVQLSCHPVQLMDADGTPGTRIFDMIGKSGAFRLTDLEPFAFTSGLTQVFRRSLLAHNALWAASCDPDRPLERAAHDQWFFFLAAVTDGVVHTTEPLALYRQHGANAFGAPPLAGSIFHVDAAFVAERVDKYEGWVMACRNRLDTLSSLREPGIEAAARAAERHYRHALAVLENRLAFYRASGTGRRAALLAQNLSRGHYAKALHPWNLGARSLAKDVATVVLTPRLGEAPNTDLPGQA